jgi:putative ABC transport system permease protein
MTIDELETAGWNRAVRATKALALAAVVETAVTIGHFVYSARLYEEPERLHVVGPALAVLAVTGALTALFVRRPGRILSAALSAVTGVMYVGVFGLFHGGYSHLLKNVAFFAGAPDETLEWLFMSPDYARPDDVAFEISGILGLVASGFVAFWLVRLVRATWHRPDRRATVQPSAQLQTAAPQAGPLRLVGLALRMLFDTPFKSLGTLVGVVVSVFLMAQQSSLLFGILGRVTSFVDKSGVDIWITSVATESTDATDSLPASKVGAAASTPGVAWASPVVQGVGRVTRPDGVREYVKVLGVEPPRYAGLPRSLAPGTSAASLRASGRVLLNWNDRPTFAAAEPGDRVEVDGNAGVVAGFFQGMDPHSPYYYMFANIDDARAMTEYPLDRVTYIAVGLAPGYRVHDVKANLEARIPEALVRTRDEFAAMEERYFLVRTPVGLVFGMGSLFAALIGAAIVAVTLYSTAVDRARDYGTLKAIGARRIDILQLMFVQAWIFFAVGYAIGMIEFFGVRAHFPQLPMVAPPKVVLGVAAAAFASCSLASLVAIRRVLLVDPAIVFRG